MHSFAPVALKFEECPQSKQRPHQTQVDPSRIKNVEAGSVIKNYKHPKTIKC